MIELTNAVKKFNIGRPNEMTALDDISLKISDGEMLAITGRSGAGKSTLLHIIGCLDSLTEGSCRIDGKETKDLSDSRLAKLRNDKIGILLQDFGLIGSETAYHNVVIPLLFSKTPLRKMREKAEKSMRLAGIAELSGQKTSTMSGGQKQRVALARALVSNPSVLLCDEPTGALDSKTADEMMGQLMQLNKNGVTVVIVTHDAKVAACCKSRIELSDGRLFAKAGAD